MNSTIYVLTFSIVQEEAGPDGRDIVRSRMVESPYLATLKALVGPLESAGYMCTIDEKGGAA